MKIKNKKLEIKKILEKYYIQPFIAYGDMVLSKVDGGMIFDFDENIPEKISNQIVDILNNTEDMKNTSDLLISCCVNNAYSDCIGIQIIQSDKNSENQKLSYPIGITIRGWGNLTGTGAHNLPDKVAIDIQNTLRDWIIEKLSNY